MIQSMTGYAVASADSPLGALALELRSVNSRYLDIQFRMPDDLRGVEPALRELIAARIARGKLECRVALSTARGRAAPTAGTAELERLRQLEIAVLDVFPDAAPLSVAEVLRWPGVLAEPAADEAQLRAVLESVARRALDELCAARAREGARLSAALLERVAAMRRRVADVAPLVPAAVAAQRARLAERLREALGAAPDERIGAEVALFAAKSDVDEELTRLAAHLDEVERVLAASGAPAAEGGPAGKRLDFLAQELNREANTLASKAASAAIADCALELKLLIEQLREQVQNIE